MQEASGAAAEVAVSCYQLSDERTRPLYGGETGRRCPGRRLAGVYRRRRACDGSASSRRARDEIFGFYTFIVPRGDAPDRRRPPAAG